MKRDPIGGLVTATLVVTLLATLLFSQGWLLWLPVGLFLLVAAQFPGGSPR